MHRVYKSIDSIYRRAMDFSRVILRSVHVGIPMAGVYPAIYFTNLPGYKPTYNVCVVDTICDSGKTFKEFCKRMPYDSYSTLAILTKEKASFKPDYTLFEVKGYDQDLWFYGFGLDLIPGNILGLDYDPGRTFNCIMYCEPVISKVRVEYHPIGVLLKKYRPDLLDSLIKGNEIDFRQLFKPSHELRGQNEANSSLFRRNC